MHDEEATRKNLISIRDHAVTSRKIVRELELKLENYRKENDELKEKFNNLQKQLQAIQVKLFSGGATS